MAAVECRLNHEKNRQRHLILATAPTYVRATPASGPDESRTTSVLVQAIIPLIPAIVTAAEDQDR